MDGPVIVRPPPKTVSPSYFAGSQRPTEPHILETTFQKTKGEVKGEEETEGDES